LTEGAGEWYELERRAIAEKAYAGYRKVFERFSKFDGGVPDFDW
jgi:hypothetical protein